MNRSDGTLAGAAMTLGETPSESRGRPMTENTPGAARSRRWTAAFVAAAWAAMAVATLVYVARHVMTSPYADELRWVGVITGAEPLTAHWFFQIENQHVCPVFKLVYMATGWATGFDFRGGALLSAALLSAVALAGVAAAARIRGRASALDVLIPVIFLHWGHYVNLIWGFQLCYVLPAVLACAVVLLMASSPSRMSVARAAAASACSMAAALCGGPGVFYFPFVALWLGYGAIRRWAESRRAATVVSLIAIVTLLPLGFWLPTLSSVARQAQSDRAGTGVMLRGASEFLSMSLGKFGDEIYPASALAVIALLGAAAWRLCRTWREVPRERLRAAGLGLFLCGAVAMSLGTGIARGTIGCLEPRYILLCSPLVLCLYFVGVAYGPEIRRAGARWACAAALVLLACLYDVKGLSHTIDLEWRVRRLENAVAQGLPPEAVAVRNYEDVQDFSAASLAKHLAMLRAAGLGPYRRGLPVAPARDVIVSPMLRLKNSKVASDMKSPSESDPLVQGFAAEPSLKLYRIDIKARVRGRGRARFRWTVDELCRDGRRRTRAEGQYVSDGSSDPQYVTLEWTPFCTQQGSRLELRIVPAAKAGPAPQVPLYAVGSDRRGELGMLAFLFYERGPAPVRAAQ